MSVLIFISSGLTAAYAANEYLGGKWSYYAIYWNYDSTILVAYHTPLKDAARKWNGFGIPGPNGTLEIVTGTSNGLNATEKTQMLTHEFGHILGLAHVTEWFTDSVMDEGDVFNLNNPTTYDINNLSGLYP